MLSFARLSKSFRTPLPVRYFAKKVVQEPIDDTRFIQKPLPEYLKELMSRRPSNASGYINLPLANFKKMVRRAETAEDVEVLKEAHVNYLGHRNILPQKEIDRMMVQALEAGHGGLMLEWFSLHEQMLYHPHTDVIEMYLAKFTTEGYEKVKVFFNATKGKYFLKRPDNFHEKVIEMAVKEGDSETVIAAYLDVLDYSTLNDAIFKQVLETMSFTESIDHALFKHITGEMSKRGQDIRLYNVVYLVNTNGGLQGADVLDELSSQQLPESPLFKNEVVAHLTNEESVLDSYVKEKLISSLKNCNVNKEFYEVESLLKEEEVEEAVEAPTEQAEPEPEQKQE